MNKIKVLSLFDGISGAKQALNDLGIESEYYASEVDKYAIQISKANHPGIVQMEDVKFLEVENNYLFYNQNNDPMKNGGSVKCDFDLLIGGSPCQNLSIAGNGEGLKGDKSSLFYEYVRILKQTKPKYFVLENVNSMKKADKETITEELFDIEPIMINSALVTAQQRKRLYWVGKLIDGKYEQLIIEQPKDKEIYLKDIIENGDTEKLKSYAITATYSNACTRDYFLKSSRQLIFNKPVRVGQFNKGGQSNRVYHTEGKSVCLSANGGGRGAKTGLYEIKPHVRKLTPIECERLQGFPDNFTSAVSNSQRYKGLGNSFTVPVIKHILKSIF
jgi:DNA-cytosine methyltransferase